MNYKKLPCGTLNVKENLVEIPKIQLTENQDSRAPMAGLVYLALLL